jgi:hypothetical protein
VVAVITIIKGIEDRYSWCRKIMLGMALKAIYCQDSIVGICFRHIQIGMGLDLIAIGIHKFRRFFPYVLVSRPMTEQTTIGNLGKSRDRLIKRLGKIVLYLVRSL